MKKNINILVIDPGSTSTKIGIFRDKKIIFRETVKHDKKKLNQFAKIIDQEEFRYQTIISVLESQPKLAVKFDAIAGRGGMIKPVPSGTYLINDKMLNTLKREKINAHPCNLGAILANRFAKQYNCKSYIVDPVIIDEMDEIARFTGLKEIKRKSQFHALNQKEAARRACQKLGKPYHKSNLIVAHLGGGISIGAHKKGKVTDVNNALDGDGPFSPERSGSLPVCGILQLIKKDIYSVDDLLKTVSRRGGMYSHLKTIDFLKVEKAALSGDKKNLDVIRAMTYQIGKEIGALAAALKGNIDAIILTGGLAQSNFLINQIKGYVRFIGKVYVMPGEFELEALGAGVMRVLTGRERVKKYEG